MRVTQIRQVGLTIGIVTVMVVSSAVAHAQGVVAHLLEETVASRGNYDKAAFRLWYPKDADTLRAIVVLMPGSNGDGRSMVDDSVWQSFAVRHKVALLGCWFTDRPHAQDFIEEYANASQGSGQALLDAITAFATHAKHAELAAAPLLLWGMSAGGEFNYEFVAWKPERVAAFVANKGGIYYTALMSRAARDVPGMLFVGGKDIEFRTNTLTGLFAVNRRAGALWAFAEEPGVAHVVGRSQALAAIFFEDVLSLRINTNAAAPGVLTVLTEQSGFLGDLKTNTIQASSDGKVPGYPTAWLPTERVARAWRALVTEMPFDASDASTR